MPSESLSFDVLFHRYLQQLELLNYSTATCRVHQFYFNRFAEFLAEVKIADAQAITPARCRTSNAGSFTRRRSKARARSVGSQNHVLIAIRNFLAFLTRRAISPAILPKTCGWPGSRRPLPRNILTPQEARQMIEAPDTQNARRLPRPDDAGSALRHRPAQQRVDEPERWPT